MRLPSLVALLLVLALAPLRGAVCGAVCGSLADAACGHASAPKGCHGSSPQAPMHGTGCIGDVEARENAIRAEAAADLQPLATALAFAPVPPRVASAFDARRSHGASQRARGAGSDFDVLRI